ncbi:MAG: FtsW/RodA/SpoVE family cell cycle protein [Tepidisphaeraceae bacterium]
MTFLRQLSLPRVWPMLAAVAFLTFVGVLTIWAADPAAGKKQLIFFGIAAGCLVAFQLVDYRIIGTYGIAFYAGAALLILYTVVGSVVSVPGVTKRGGAFNWIDFGPFSLQPSELMKVAFVMVLARYLRFRSNYRTLAGLLPPFLLAAGPMLLILKQPDLGTALIFIPTLFAMLFVAGAKLKHLLGVAAIALACGPVLWLSGLPGVPVFEHLPALIKPYQRDRVFAMFSEDPDTMLEGTGMQQYKALIAIGSGGIFGKGPMNVPAGRRIPENTNDMVFALIAEQFGLVGSMIVIAAYLVIFVVAIEIGGSTREPFARLVAVGVVAMLAGQTFVNLLVVTKLMPVTGVTLPFVSSGGSSLIASYLSVGLLMNVGQKRPIVMGKRVFEFEE